MAAVAVGGALVAVGLLAARAGHRQQVGQLHACLSCGDRRDLLAMNWAEVPEGDAWSFSPQPGVGVVVRGPARFEIAGLREGQPTLALSRGVLAFQVAGAGKAVLLMPRNNGVGIEGATLSNAGAGARVVVDAEAGGNVVTAGAGSALVQVAAGPKTVTPASAWSSGPKTPAAPALTATEQRWLDELAPLPR